MLSETELKELQDLAIAAFAREVRAAKDFVDLARILGIPKLRALRQRAAELSAAREAQVSSSASSQPQFALRPTGQARFKLPSPVTLRECPNCHTPHVLGTCPECNP